MEIVHLVFGKQNKSAFSLATAVDQLATEQVRLGYNVKLWEISPKSNDDFQQRPYKTCLFNVKNFLWNTTQEINEAINKLKKDTIVHMHGGFIPVYFTLAYHLKRKKIPFVYTTHGTYNRLFIQSAGIAKKIYFHLFENLLVKWSSAMHFVSNDEQFGFQENHAIDQAKMVFIPNGLANGNKLVPPKIKKNEEPIFCFMGQLDIHEKGLDILLAAFAEYKHKYFEKGVLWIIGEGVGKENLYKMAVQLNIQQSVFFKPTVYGVLKFELLNKVDVFLRPSRAEYFPSAILEAASTSVPSIVSKETNMGNYINEYNAGYTMEENNAGNLSRLMITCLKDIKNLNWDNKRRNAYKMVNEKFQWNKIAMQHISVYEKVLDQIAA